MAMQMSFGGFDPAFAMARTTGTAHSNLTARQASKRLWWSLAFFFISFGVGTSWDRAWHATHVFDDFYSPPHLFIYSTFAISALIFATLAFSPERRAWYGDDMRVPVLGWQMPAAIVLAGCGFATIAIAGALDDVWHTNFGLDETNWSTPHAMLGWGILLTWSGFLACRHALRPHIPISRPFIAVAGLITLSLTTSILLGALGKDATPDMVRHIAALPPLQASSQAQHTFRILLTWNLTRTNPLFVPAAAAAAGVALACIRGLTRSTWMFLAVAAVATLFGLTGGHRTASYFHLAGDARNWLPIPFVAAAIVFVCAKQLRRSDTTSWLLAGLAFSALVASWWGPGPALALLAAPAMPLGAYAGARLYRAIEHPSAASVRVMAATAVAVPALLGLLDLYLRWHTA
ncbi:MAG TPA: hypothetical protein VEZ14_13600 [Dehalococcoidia bacterium]|nr:hypothetical protein [Dehalococcoidia bacterium]